MVKILHIIDKITGSGPTRSIITSVKIAAKLGLKQQHRIIALNIQAYPISLFLAKQAGITIIREPSSQTRMEEIENADIVHFHFWNNPDIYEFLRPDKPAMRFLTHIRIHGATAPQVITRELLDYSDFILATSCSTLDLPVFKNVNSNCTDVVYGIADWDRLKNVVKKQHEGFNVGYIGTVNFAKLHPKFIQMSASVEIPDVKFLVYGGGIEKELHKQAVEMNAAGKFGFGGYVENIKPILENLDVFGYPLCEGTYATSEKSLQEAMYAGIPPVVFPYGGVKHLVQNNETGLIVNSEVEYKEAIEFLFKNPNERLRLGENARKYAISHFDGEHWVRKQQDVYEQMIKLPKSNRSWNFPADSSEKESAAELFIQSLGMSAPYFQISYSSSTLDEVLAADSIIADAAPVLAGGEGGIFQYRNHYSEDPHLRVWSGLVLQKNGNHYSAMKEFSTAIESGYIRPNVFWHLHKSAMVVGDDETALSALIKVNELAPDFEASKTALKSGTLSGSENPLISVIMVVYNREKYIREALESILADQYSPKEIIVVDDGSSDNTVKIVADFPDVILLCQENCGVSVARNVGIRASKGAYITFLDSDDIWMPGRIEAGLDFFNRQPEISFIFGQEVMFLEEGVQKPALILQEWIEKPRDASNNGSIMAKRLCYEKIGLFNPEYKKDEDTEWNIRALQGMLKMIRIPFVFHRRRIHDSNISLVQGDIRNKSLLKIMHESIKRKKEE